MQLNNPLGLRLPDHIDPAKLQAVINHFTIDQGHLSCPLKAQDFIDCSHHTGVMPDVMVAQAVQESRLGTILGSRSMETRNMFNVGNVDAGANRTMSDWHTGLYCYATLMAHSYGLTAEAVCGNDFKDHAGNSYASDPNYPQEIWALVLKIRSMLQ